MKLAVLLAIAVAASAQMQDNRAKEMTCEQSGRQDRSHSCNITEQTIASAGKLNVDPGGNGGIHIKGWTRGDVLVRTKIEAWADSDSEATLLASQVHSDAGSGQIRASGPDSHNNSGWAAN